ncbi:MAG: hypothetical protein AB1625_04080 [Acidobacteriota bacterium]
MRTPKTPCRSLLVILFVLAAAGPVRAEQPAWSEIAGTTYVVLRMNPYFLSGPNDEGIWSFDPEDRSYVRLAPFYYERGAGVGWAHGEGSYLTTLDDRLLFESPWSFYEFSPGDWRVVRRYVPLAEQSWNPNAGIEADGVGRSDAAQVGLTPGLYGLTFALNDVPRGWMAWRPPEPDAGTAVALVDLARFGERPPFTTQRNVLTFDPLRGGFWLVWEGRIHFLPVSGGAIEVEAAVEVPVDYRLDALLRHPATGRFVGRRILDDVTRMLVQFVGLDAGLRITDVYGTWGSREDDPKERVPWTFAAFSTQPPEEHVQTIPIVARTPGRNGTLWTSDLWLYNPSATATIVRVRRVAAPSAAELTVDLGPHASWHVDDTLAWAGGGPGGDGVAHDALVVTSPYRWGEQVVAVSRCTTPSSDPVERASGGTMGHAVVAVPGRVGYSNHILRQEEDGSPPALLPLEDRASRFRHNFGVVNDGTEPLELTLWWGMDHSNTFYRLWPPVENSRVVTVPPHSVEVVALEELFPAEMRAEWPAKLAVTGHRAAAIWLSIVDQLTGDATFVPYSVLSLKGDAETTMAFPVLADIPGDGGSRWRSDMFFDEWAFHGGPTEFHPSGPTNVQVSDAGARGQDVLALEWLPWIVRDAVRRMVPEGNVRGAEEVHVGSWMAAFSRTYTERADGGTYGEMLPLYPPRGWPVQHFAGIEAGSRFRVNLGLYNGDGEHAITHRLRLYAADGSLAAERDVVLQPRENDVRRLELWLGLDRDSLPAGTYGLTVLPLDDPAQGVEGRSWAFVSLVDSVTNDPTNWW